MAPTTRKPEMQSLALLEIDYTRPSRLDELYRVQKQDARAKRRERINTILGVHNIAFIPYQGRHTWTPAIGMVMENWAVANIPGWKAHHDPNRPLDAEKVARYANGHATAVVAGHQEGAGRYDKKTKTAGVKRGRSAVDAKEDGEGNGVAEFGGSEADVEDFGALDEESDVESVEDADEYELRIITAKRTEKVAAKDEKDQQIAVAKQKMIEATKVAETSGRLKPSRRAKKQKVREDWRTWDPALDTESADDDLSFAGYFTTKAELKENPAHPESTVYALVPKYKRKNTTRNAVRRNMGDVYHANDLEEHPQPPLSKAHLRKHFPDLVEE